MGKNIKGKELGKGISQRKDGKYEARYKDRFGKRKSIYNRNLAQLKAEYKKCVEESRNSKITSSKTLDEWFLEWIEVYKVSQVKEGSLIIYQNTYQKHISPVLGKILICDIKQIQIMSLLNKMADNGLKYESQNKVCRVLSDMFKKAIENDFAYKNPVYGIKLKKEVESPVALSTEEEKMFFDCAKGTFYYNFFKFAHQTGLRLGELCALTLEDISFEKDKESVRVEKTLLYQKGTNDDKKMFKFGSPKTESSRRKVPLSPDAIIAIKEQIKNKKVIANKSSAKEVKEEFKNLLFTTKYNTPLNAEIVKDAIKKIVDQINLLKDEEDKMEEFSSHTFRHTFATRCFEGGIEPKVVQEYLGHATLKMTMDLYTHVMPKIKSDSITKLNPNNETLFNEEDTLGNVVEFIKTNEQTRKMA